MIWLCRDLPLTLHRFTLAHELGHVILHCHGGRRLRMLASRIAERTGLLAAQALQQTAPELSRDDPCHTTDVQEDMTGLLDQEQFQEALGSGQSYDPRSQREVAANIFAAALLLPIERVRKLYLVERAPAATLAQLFGVSHSALLNRLAGLLKNPLPGGTRDVESEAPPPQRQAAAPGKQYDQYQRAAIEAVTPALIVAGPGSGKTSTLIGRVEHMVRTLNIPPPQILALTFSRKAAQEMEERLQKMLGTDTRSLAVVSTFHAFCADLLRQHGTHVGLRGDFALIDEAEGYFLLRQAANEMRLRHYQKLQSPAYYFPDFLKAISRAKDELILPQAYAELAQRLQEQARDEETLEKAEKALEIAGVYALYEQELQRRGDTDFGGLLTLTLQLFEVRPDILHEQQQKYQHILVDEFQDVNRASGVLLRELAGGARRVWVVGDANQAIYGFRGASPANISQFTQDFPGAVVLPLSRNYRSRPDLVALAEAFRCVQLELGQEPGKNEPVRLTQPDTYVSIARASDEESELAGLARDIHYKHAHGYAYRDMIVLCRTRAQVQKISRFLATEGLPVVEQGGMLEQEHIKDVLSIVLLLLDASGMGLLRAARLPEHPLSQKEIEALLLAAREPGTNVRSLLLAGEVPLSISVEGRHALLRLSQILQALQYASDTWSLLAQYLLIETASVRDLLSGVQSKQRDTMLADYDRLLQLARHYDQRRARVLSASEGQEQSSPVLEERLKGWLEYLSLLVLLRQDGGSRQGSEDGDEENANIIHVMTVHASKGLEFPVVYMPGLVQRRFPLQARASAAAPPAGMLHPESEGSAAHESGESCLFYVGVTRARDQLVLSYSERYGKLKYKRSLYLDALEAGLPAERITMLRWDSKETSTAVSDSHSATPGSSQPSEQFIRAMCSPKLSASAIEAYQRCPRQYAYSNIYRFSSEADGYQLFWQATQKTIEELRTGLVGARPGEEAQPARVPQQQEIQELYTRHWQALGGHTAPFAPMYEQHGHEVVEALRRDLSTQEEVTWDARPGFDVDIAGKTVRVTVDRVEQASGTQQPVKFVRTRFGRRREKPTAETRELFYALASRQCYPGQPVELHSHNMSTGEVTPVTMTSKKEQGLYEGVEQAIKGLEENAYPALPAEPFRCPSCPFFFICPA